MDEAARRAFGRRIATLLDAAGMTQKELADRIGGTPAAVCRYVSGQRAPRADTLARIARALETDSERLLGQEHAPDDAVKNAVKTVVAAAADMDDSERLALIAAIASAGEGRRI